jgi:hypothetical protein
MKSYGLVKKLHDIYLEKYGTCRCQDVQKSKMGRSYNLWNANELKDAMTSGMMEHCSDLVGSIARMTTELILDSGFEP